MAAGFQAVSDEMTAAATSTDVESSMPTWVWIAVGIGAATATVAASVGAVWFFNRRRSTTSEAMFEVTAAQSTQAREDMPQAFISPTPLAISTADQP